MQHFWKALALALVAQVGIAFAAAAAVNINTATKDELVALPGIGPAKAQAIIDHRTQNGPFRTVDDLKSVKGIGAKRLEALRPDLTVGPATSKVATAPGKGEVKPAGPAAKGEVRGADKKPAR
ncbi:MAG: helix-hairpin-helix domain-containing protein [Burkholderiales bacterium]|nr:helix-hairpin-helix domain-containing protein [Burkholderiales bacterium]